LTKTWLRIKDFIVIAWPLLIIGSIVLSLAEHFQVDTIINKAVSPLTIILGLPSAVGTTLIFGVLRKELSMLMLLQALNVADVSSVMSPGQILVFTIFIVFYIPCLATIGIMAKELGWKRTIYASIFTFFLALGLGVLTRGFAAIFL
jgi:ferrous iron transport protein B